MGWKSIILVEEVHEIILLRSNIEIVVLMKNTRPDQVNIKIELGIMEGTRIYQYTVDTRIITSSEPKHLLRSGIEAQYGKQ
jgi:hypothetical protein